MKTIKFFFKGIVFCILCGALVLGYAYYIEPNMLSVKNVKINSAKLQNNLKIAFFSDTHIGKSSPDDNLDKIVSKINEMKPDIVIFGGDLIDRYHIDKPDTGNIVSKLEKINARYGKYAVWGNHDYGGGAHRVYKDILENSGFKLLKNQSIYIDALNINLIGTDDYLFGTPKLTDANKKSAAYNILISHAPDTVDEINLDNIDYILAGHSHGGQIYIPILSNYIVPPGAKNYLKGEYILSEIATLFVSSGIGQTQLPLRFLNKPEIIELNIN